MIENLKLTKIKGENSFMAKPTIIPQKFTFEKPTIKNGKGETISH